MRRAAVSLALVPLALLSGAAAAAPGNRPSDRGCLIAWNAPANGANRARLVAAHPSGGLSLRSGTSVTDRWVKGRPATTTSTQACLLTVSRPDNARIVIGAWRLGRVARWTWGPVMPPTAYVAANVRLLPDGRVTKLYRR